jgi:uroporphyrinogen-III decarboxylase
MDRQYYLSLATAGLRMAIGADLTLHEEPDPESSRQDPDRLAGVVERTARRYRTPLAFPLMDLTIEKEDLLVRMGVAREQTATFHFHSAPEDPPVGDGEFPPRLRAHLGALRRIAAGGQLLPVGMLIGPFSLMTKLVEDPIAGVALAGRGFMKDEEPSVGLVESCLKLALATVLRSAQAQIEAGARAMVVCEPAANSVYLSRRQLSGPGDILDRFVLEPNRQLQALLRQGGVDLFFHNCGELTTAMVERFARELRPAILSLGSSRKLWEDAAVVDRDIVLFGNLPTKTFYSDSAMPIEQVRLLTNDLLSRMRACLHPHILGSECDVLHVPGCEQSILAKIAVMAPQ